MAFFFFFSLRCGGLSDCLAFFFSFLCQAPREAVLFSYFFRLGAPRTRDFLLASIFLALPDAALFPVSG